jgi:hypothetical protein
MAYGTIKVDTITFTDAGVDKSVTISGLVQNPTFSGNITVTGTISGNTVQGQTVSGATVTGTTANFVSGVFTTQISGATITGNVGSFTTITGGTVTLTSGVFASGTAAAPSVSIGTTDNGLYSPGADQVAVATNGTGRLFVDASGNVGVGTSSVNALLEVNNSTAGGEVQRIEGNYDGSGSVTLTNWRRAGGSVAAALKYNDDSSPLCMSIGTTTSHEFRIRTADTDAITIDASQRVGIGTSAPAERLTVNGAVAVTGGITGHGANRTTLSQEGLGGAFWQSYGADTSTPGVFQLRQASSDFSVNRVPLFIDSSGRLGIGTSTPGANLEVFGDTADVVLTSVTNNNATGANKSLNCGVGGATAFSVPPWPNSGFIDSATTNGLALGSSSSTGSVRLYTGTSREERLRITSAGLVGIGTSSPGALLDLTATAGAGGQTSVIRFGLGAAAESYIGVANAAGNIIANSAQGDTVIRNDGGKILFSTDSGTTAHAVIDSSGRLGIGTTSPATKLDIIGANEEDLLFLSTGNTPGNTFAQIRGDNEAGIRIKGGGSFEGGTIELGGGLRNTDPGTIKFSTGTSSGTSTERARIDSSGRLLVGTSSSSQVGGGLDAALQVESTSQAGSRFSILRRNSNNAGPVIALGKTGGSGNEVVLADDALGTIDFSGGDGTDVATSAARIRAEVDGTPGANDMPGRLVFSTTSDGASSPTERLRITSAGNVGIGTTTPISKLEVDGDIRSAGRGTSFGFILPDWRVYNSSGGNALVIDNYTTEALRVDSSNRLLVGTSTSTSVGGSAATVQILGTGGNPHSLQLTREDAPVLAFGKTSVGSGANCLGVVAFAGNDTNDLNSVGATIGAFVDGTIGVDDLPTRLVFSTTPDGASAPTERLRITSAGLVGIGSTVPNEKLTVADSGSANVYIALQNSTTGTTSADGWYLGAAGTEFQIYGKENGPITFSPNSTERARIDASGRLGIGTSDPSSFLHVDSADTYGSVVLSRNGGAAGRRPFGVGITGPTDAQLRISASSDTLGANAFANQIIDITADGKVGIGTTTVDALLEVYSPTNGANLAKFSDAFNNRCLIVKGASGGVNLIAAEETNEASTAFGIAFSRGATEMGRFDGSGRLLVGTSSNLTEDLLQVQTTDGAALGFFRNSSADGITNGGIRFSSSNGTTAMIKGEHEGAHSSGSSPGRLVFSTTADGASSPTERMRINSAGALKASLAGTYESSTSAYHELRTNSSGDWIAYFTQTTTSNPNGVLIKYTGAAPNNTGSTFLYCEDNAAVRATIRSNGGFANYQANDVNLSDRNVKKDIAPAAGTWDCIKDWEIVNYRYKDQPDDADLNLGVIAQQVAESCPEVITVFEEAKDDQPEKLGVKEQQMYWMAIKALQEAQVRIEQLEQRLNDAGIN